MSKIPALKTLFFFMYGRPPQDHESIVWLYYDLMKGKV